MASKPSSYGPTEAVADAIAEAAAMSNANVWTEAEDVPGVHGPIVPSAFLTALRARGYVVTKEYQE